MSEYPKAFFSLYRLRSGPLAEPGMDEPETDAIAGLSFRGENIELDALALAWLLRAAAHDTLSAVHLAECLERAAKPADNT